MNYIFSNDFGVIGYMSRHIDRPGRVFPMMLPADMAECGALCAAPDTATAISARTIRFYHMEKTGDWLVDPHSAHMLLDATSEQCARMGVVVTAHTRGAAHYDHPYDNKIGVRFDAATGETWLSDFNSGKKPRDLVNFSMLGPFADSAVEYLKSYLRHDRFEK